MININSVKGQNYFTELKSLLEKIENSDSVDQKIKSENFKNLDLIGVYVELNRKIDFDYEQHRIKVLHLSGQDLKINFISKNGKIIYGWISEYDEDEEKHSKLTEFKRTIGFLENYTLKHNELYNSEFDQKVFEKQILAEYIVGFGCGFGGNETSLESEQSIYYSENKDIGGLNELLKSFSPELQTLGTIGLLKIAKVNNEQKIIIEHLKNRNSEINTCAGCIYGIHYPYSKMIKRYE